MVSIFSDLMKTGIDFVDVGCRGGIESKWKDLAGLLNYVGFDPDENECQKLSSELNSTFLTSKFYPYAVGETNGQSILYETSSPDCSSLLKPRYSWLQRFKHYDSFKVVNEKKIDCVTLDYLVEKDGLNADILKIDSQGFELQILKSSTRLLKNSFCVETETGFVENYNGESEFPNVAEFMRKNGFLLFDMKTYRMVRANDFSIEGKHQLNHCESVWLRDYLEIKESISADNNCDRIKAIKSLIICKHLKFLDYGYELANHYNNLGLIQKDEFRKLKDKSTWQNNKFLLEDLFCIFPRNWRIKLYEALGYSIEKPHLLKKLVK